MNLSTIAAISTPHGKGGVAVLRISGPEAISISQRIFRPMSGKALEDYESRFQIYGNIVSSDGKNVLDDGLLTYFKGPNSFTGEDVVEISCHGGEIVTSMVLSAILESGAVLAGPGEFSRRAFVNGKLSLTAAEGIADLLDARTEAAALLSSKSVRGKLSQEIASLSDSLLKVSSSLWAYLDYPEEDLQSLSDEEMIGELNMLAEECRLLLKTFDTGRAINSGIPAVIVGKPNAGKSTFFNRLLGEDRAIVTSIPGTTRDLIDSPLKLGRVLLNLCDTAGVRETGADAVEGIGIERALSALHEAEIVFALFDISRPLEEDDQIVLDALANLDKDVLLIPVLTKSDLESKLDLDQLPFAKETCLVISQTDVSLSLFVEKVEKAFISDESALREGRIITNARQKSNLVKGLNLILEGIDQIANSQKDLASLTLESALAAILEIDGKSAGEKILDEVFSRFCIGK